MMQTISIITPSYNQGKFIEKTIKSILSQKILHLEYLVVDGGSNDNTIDILKKYDKEIRWVSEKDKGQTDAINKGIQQTSGEIIGWLNSDDIYYPNALAKIQKFFAQYPEIDILYGNANHIDTEDNFIEAYYTEEWNIERLKQVCFISQPAVFLRRSVVEKYGLLQENLEYCMDYEYWIRLALAGVRFSWFRETLAATRLHKETKTLGARLEVHTEINNMLKEKLGYVPMRWLRNYGSIMLEEKTNLKHNPLTFAFLSGLLTLIYSLKWNRSLNKEVRQVISEQWKPVSFDRIIHPIVNNFKYVLNKLYQLTLKLGSKLLPRKIKNFVKSFRKT